MNKPIDELPNIIEAYIAKRDERIGYDHASQECKKEETRLKEIITKTLDDNGLKSGGGLLHRATLVPKNKPVAEDWPMFYKYVAETNGFDMLQKRLTEKAVQARWEDNIVVPGIIIFPVWDLSVTKV